MSHENDRISGLVLKAQMDMFRLAVRDTGQCLKDIAAASAIPYPNILYYSSGKGAIPLAAVLKLAGVIPDNLLSLLFSPIEKCLSDCQVELFQEAAE